jgi:lipopolysaccharide transport system permease protein
MSVISDPVKQGNEEPVVEPEFTVDEAQERLPHVVIRATRGFGALRLKEIWAFRDLLWALASRDVKVRYKQTALGVIWVVLQPLLAAGILSFVFGKVAKMPADNGVPVFVLSYAGQLGWGLFGNTVTRASTCLIGNSNLIAKVFFPRLILPLSTVGSVFIDFAVAALMMAVVMMVGGVTPTWAMLTAPVWMGLLLVLALGAGLWAAALTVSYRDVQHVMPVLIQFGMYASPVGYSIIAVPERLRTWYYVNPLAALLDAFRWSVLGMTHTPDWWAVGYAGVMAVAVLTMGALVFKRMERRFADVI